MDGKSHKVLHKIFKEPPSDDLSWDAIEGLLAKLAEEFHGHFNGGSVSGARTRVLLNGVIGIFPYPQRANPSTIKRVREFLEKAGVKP